MVTAAVDRLVLRGGPWLLTAFCALGLAWSAWWTWNLWTSPLLYGIGPIGAALYWVLGAAPSAGALAWRLHRRPASSRARILAFWGVALAGAAAYALTPQWSMPDAWLEVFEAAGGRALVGGPLLPLPPAAYPMMAAYTLYPVPAAAALLWLAQLEDRRRASTV